MLLAAAHRGLSQRAMQDPLMSQGYDVWTPTLRIARATDNIDALLPFYVDGLGFQILTRFEDHEGFSGIVLGHPGQAYHLEFTHHHGHKAGRAPTKDNLLAIYLPQRLAYQAAIGAMVLIDVYLVYRFRKAKWM